MTPEQTTSWRIAREAAAASMRERAAREAEFDDHPSLVAARIRALPLIASPHGDDGGEASLTELLDKAPAGDGWRLDISVGEMTDLIEYLFKWGAENGVVWSDPTQEKAA